MKSPFNLNTYAAMLRRAMELRYRFIGFEELEIPPSHQSVAREFHSDKSSHGRILLRHDVDGDLAAALKMASREAELGVLATYFLMFRSPCYNLMSRAGHTFAAELVSLGHQIGLHYDQGFDAIRGLPLKHTEAAIAREAEWLEQLLGVSVAAVSFHQPSSALLQSGVDCGNRINTYNQSLLAEFQYFSDSNRVFPLFDAVEAAPNAIDFDFFDALAVHYPKNIQLLIHPMWWVYEETSTEDVWDSVLLSNLHQAQNQMLATERAYGARRTFAISREPNHD